MHAELSLGDWLWLELDVVQQLARLKFSDDIYGKHVVYYALSII